MPIRSISLPKAASRADAKEHLRRSGIPCGRYTGGGFVPHDLRHQAGKEMVRAGDIKTASDHLKHSNINRTLAYLHTDAFRIKKAVRRRDEMKERRTDVEKHLRLIYDEAVGRKISVDAFLEKISKFINFSGRANAGRIFFESCKMPVFTNEKQTARSLSTPPKFNLSGIFQQKRRA